MEISWKGKNRQGIHSPSRFLVIVGPQLNLEGNGGYLEFLEVHEVSELELEPSFNPKLASIEKSWKLVKMIWKCSGKR